MNVRLSARALALLAGASLVFGATTVAVPAFAEDAPPTPAPTSSAPVAPAPPAPTAPATAPAGTVDYTGRVTQLSDESRTPNPNVRLFHVTGSGYLRVDLSKVELGTTILTDITLRFAVPASLTLSVDADARFQQLAVYSTGTAPLAATAKVVSSSRVKAMVNQSPATTALQTVYAVLVTPKEYSDTTAAANQTEAKVRASVAHADTYWSNQSGGKVHFQLGGTTTWYKSTKSCIGDTTALWTEAAAKATAQLGYRDAANLHLALFFPTDPTISKCGPGVGGLGTIGYSVNSGGWVWVVGTDAPVAQASLAHELGHNLTFGHADLLDCANGNPHPGFLGTTDCTVDEYGDVTDVMAFGTDGADGGAVSSPNAIRSGIWGAPALSSTYAVAPTGTNSYVLNAVSSHSGLRSVVVEDTDGVNYFVEYRNQTGEDAQYADYGCGDGACAASTPGVRVLRLQQQNIGTDDSPLYLKGLNGDDSFLISRHVGDDLRIDYHAGESFSSTAAGGVVISVSSIDGNTATVSVTRPAAFAGPPSGAGQYVGLFATLTHDNAASRVGDTWTVLIDAQVTAQRYNFEWYRTFNVVDAVATKIVGATEQSYTMTQADLGAYIGVRVIAVGDGNTQTYEDPDLSQYLGYGPISAAATNPLPLGGVTVSQTAATLQANPAGWISGTAFAYQWYRDATAVTGATAKTYLLTAADRGHAVKVRVVGSRSGYLSSTIFSDAKDYSITHTGTFGVTGTAQVGNQLTVTSSLAFSTVDSASVSPTLSYQWFRSGVAIPGATGLTYALVAADQLKTLTVSVTAALTGYIPDIVTASAGPVGSGVIDTGDAAVTVAEPTAARLLVSTMSGAVAEPGVTTTYQWFRAADGAPTAVAIAGATGPTYTLVAADSGMTINVEYLFNKPGYATGHLFAGDGKKYTTTLADATAKPVVTGTAKVGGLLTTTVPGFVANGDPVSSPELSYQWYRTNVAIAGATGATYAPTASDYLKTLTVKVTGALSGYLPATTPASLPTAAIAIGTIAGTLEAPVVTETNATLLLTAALPDGAVTETGVTFAWQWFRSGVAIAGATKNTYPLTSADYGKLITVRLTGTKLDYASYSKVSEGRNYSLTASGTLTIGGVLKIGQVLTGSAISYSTTDGAVSPTPTSQWYRNGVAIPAVQGGTGSSYTLLAADYGMAISLRQTAKVDGFLPVTLGSPATAKVTALGEIQGTLAVDVQTQLNPSPATNFTLVAVPSGITEPGIATAYQWVRNGVAIAGATHAAYVPTALDYGKTLGVRVAVSKLRYVTKTLTPPPLNYSLVADYTNPGNPYQAGATVPRIGGEVATGSLLTVSTPVVTAGGAPTSSATLTYRWYRTGALVADATGSTYSLTSADVGKGISVIVTVSQPGFLPVATSSARTQLVQANSIDGWDATLTVDQVSNLVLQANDAGVVASPTTHVAYQWYRDGTAIVGAKLIRYALTAADYEKHIWVREVVTRTGAAPAPGSGGYTTLVKDSASINYSLHATGVLSVTGTAQVGKTLGAAALNYSIDAGPVDPAIGMDYHYQWYRSGVAISGGTHETYTLVAADYAKRITVRVTASRAGSLPAIRTSTASAAVITGTIQTGGVALPTVTAGSAAYPLLTATWAIPEAGTASTYQWYRNGVAISKANKVTFQLSAADVGKKISVRWTRTKLKYATISARSVETDYTLVAVGPLAVDVSEGVKVGSTLRVAHRDFTLGGAGVVATLSYQWYRSGVAIGAPEGTAADYALATADLGKTMSVRVTAAYPGSITSVGTTAATFPVATDLMAGWDDPSPLTVTKSGTTSIVLTSGDVGVTEPGAVPAWQWYRGSTAIAGATHVSYTLTSADVGQLIRVRATVTHPAVVGPPAQTFAIVQKFSVAHGYTVTASGLPTISDTTPARGQLLTANLPASYSLPADDVGVGGVFPVDPLDATVVSYQWYRNGVAISGATHQKYTVSTSTSKTATSDRGKRLTVRVIVRAPGYFSLVATSAATAVVP